MFGEAEQRTGCGGEDDEACPVVFYEFAHCLEVGSGWNNQLLLQVGPRFEHFLFVARVKRVWAAAVLYIIDCSA